MAGMFYKSLQPLLPVAFLLCSLILSTNCSQKYYASEVLRIFPEVNGKIVYAGVVPVGNLPGKVLKEKFQSWLHQKDSIRGSIKVVSENLQQDSMVLKVKKGLYLEMPKSILVSRIDRTATYFEYLLYVTFDDAFIKYEVRSVKAYYYQLLGSNTAPKDWQDLVNNALTPASVYGRFDPLPVSNNLDHGYASLMGRDNLVKFYEGMDNNIKTVLQSLVDKIYR